MVYGIRMGLEAYLGREGAEAEREREEMEEGRWR
jgi:hypothetical protein